jgi:hypothetical protein
MKTSVRRSLSRSLTNSPVITTNEGKRPNRDSGNPVETAEGGFSSCQINHSIPAIRTAKIRVTKIRVTRIKARRIKAAKTGN